MVGRAQDLATCQEVRGLSDADPDTVFQHDDDHPKFVEAGQWPVSDSVTKSGTNPWSPINKIGVRWETMKFGVVSGDFSDESRTTFTMHTKVEARGIPKAFNSKFMKFGMKGHQELVFTYSSLSDLVL